MREQKIGYYGNTPILPKTNQTKETNMPKKTVANARKLYKEAKAKYHYTGMELAKLTGLKPKKKAKKKTKKVVRKTHRKVHPKKVRKHSKKAGRR